MRPAEVIAWMRSRMDVPADDLTRLVVNKKQTIFENDVHWARFYLLKSGLVASPKRGLWGLTPEGVNKHLSSEEAWDICVRVRDADRDIRVQDEECGPP